MTITMNKITAVVFSLLMLIACNSSEVNPDSGNKNDGDKSLAEQNIIRAMELTDNAISNYFDGSGMKMARFYNPYTKVTSSETGSVWMYTSAIEAVNGILGGLKSLKDSGNATLYNEHNDRYVELLASLYDNADYYKGTFTLVSYTQTKEWSVYGVNRGNDKGSAKVEGIENVYDDQQWIIRELLHSYNVTGNHKYLEDAEYFTEYVLDGWDTTLDSEGNENGGIPWGPGYTTKHSCSNGPMVSPLVWLHELYKGKDDKISHRYITTDNKREVEEMTKADYYLEYAKKVYDWQKEHLLRSDGVFHDMMGGCVPNCDIVYETFDGIKYRGNTPLTEAVGRAHSYNTGTMISGAADLYRATKENVYLEDGKQFADNSFNYFAKLDETVPGHYTYDIDGFSNWFNGVLMRGYADLYPVYSNAGKYIESFQDNLDYGYKNNLHEGMLPTNLLVGWNLDRGKNNVEGMFIFTFAAEYAVLTQYELNKK